MRFLMVSIACCILISCGEEVINKPENLIPPSKMAEILYDVALINAAKSTNPRILKENNIEVMSFIYRKYAIDSARFIDSDIYYASKPLEYEAIYREVEARLEGNKEDMEEERDRVSDSIRIEAEKQRETAVENQSPE